MTAIRQDLALHFLFQRRQAGFLQSALFGNGQAGEAERDRAAKSHRAVMGQRYGPLKIAGLSQQAA